MLGRIEKPKHIRTADQSSCSPGYVNNAANPVDYVGDMDLKVIATNVRFDESENILQFARDPINHLDESVNVVAVTLFNRVRGKLGLVKIAISSLNENKSILREKISSGM